MCAHNGVNVCESACARVYSLYCRFQNWLKKKQIPSKKENEKNEMKKTNMNEWLSLKWQYKHSHSHKCNCSYSIKVKVMATD